MKEPSAAAHDCKHSYSISKNAICEGQQNLRSISLNDSSSESHSCIPHYNPKPVISGTASEQLQFAMPLHMRTRSTSSSSSFAPKQAGTSAPLPSESEVPLVDLENWPRIAVTPSMLCAYALMKGNHPDNHNDVLHSALYPGQTRRLANRRVWLPKFGDSVSIEKLPRGTCYYWDPVTETNLSIQPGIYEEISLGLRIVPSSPVAHSYEEYCTRHLPFEGLKKYKGTDVHANFGYLKIHQTWVDPDSEGQLHNAYVKAGKETDAAYQHYVDDATEYSSREFAEPGLPIFERPDTCDGIMTPEAEEKFYKDFVEYVSDDEDGEGDPRNHRISAKTFARWATGSKFPSQYMERMPPPEPITDRNWNIGGEKASQDRKIKRTMQFDVETSSTMTGLYDVDDEPSLLQEAEGVDPCRPPNNFNMMNPMAARELNRQAYGPAWADHHQRDNTLTSEASYQAMFTSEEGVELMAQPGFPHSGAREYHDSKELINSLAWEAHRSAEQNHQVFNQMNCAGNHRSVIQQEIQFLKTRKREKTQYLRRSSPREADSGSEQDDLHSVTAVNEPLHPDALRKSRRRMQYKRHVAEAISNHAIEVTKQRVTGMKLKTELNAILTDIVELTKVKEALLQDLEIENAEQIPGLIPRRLDETEDFRAQLNKRLHLQ